jgi:hypothetical protein
MNKKKHYRIRKKIKNQKLKGKNKNPSKIKRVVKSPENHENQK